MNRFLFSFLLLSFALSLFGAQAPHLSLWNQEGRLLSPVEALRSAFATHRDAERIRMDLQEARLDARRERLRLMPRVSLDVTLPTIDDYRSEVWTTVDDSLKLLWQDWNLREDRGDLKVSAESPFGTQVNLAMGAWRRSSDSGSIDLLQGQLYSVELFQDLLPGRTLFGDLREAASTLNLREDEALDRLAAFRFRILSAYDRMHQLQAAARFADADRKQARENFYRSRERYSAGLIAESEFIKMELEVLRQQRAFQSDSLFLIEEETTFRQLIGLQEGEGFSLQAPEPSHLEPEDFELLWALVQGSSLRLKQARHAQVLAQRALWLTRLDRLPDLSLRASWSLYGEDESFQIFPESPGINRSFRVQLRLPIFDGGSAAQAVERAKLSKKRSRLSYEESEESMRTNLRKLLLRLQDLLTSAEIMSRQVEIADRDLMLSRERHEMGLIRSQDWIEAGRSLSRVRLQELENRVELHLSQLELDRLTGLDIEVLQGCLP
jgi:outer membrane protein TolC